MRLSPAHVDLREQLRDALGIDLIQGTLDISVPNLALLIIHRRIALLKSYTFTVLGTFVLARLVVQAQVQVVFVAFASLAGSICNAAADSILLLVGDIDGFFDRSTAVNFLITAGTRRIQHTLDLCVQDLALLIGLRRPTVFNTCAVLVPGTLVHPPLEVYVLALMEVVFVAVASFTGSI
jgi:hypothetical protein